jgi:hypothetical protein
MSKYLALLALPPPLKKLRAIVMPAAIGQLKENPGGAV